MNKSRLYEVVCNNNRNCLVLSFRNPRRGLMRFSKSFRDLVNKIISDNAKRTDNLYRLYSISFYDLSITTKRMFVSAYLLECDDPWHWIFHSDDENLLNTEFADYLVNPTFTNQRRFIKEATKLCIDYHADKMQDILEEFLETYEFRMAEELGFKQIQHKDNGECQWLKK